MAVAEGTQSIRRAMAVLRTLALGREAGVSLVEITRLTGLPRPTAHRILRVLVEEEVVEQRARTRRYAIGEQIGHLALARGGPSALLRAAQPQMRKLGETLGDTVFLTVRSRLDSVLVARQLGNYPVQVLALDVGIRRPLGVSTAGIAILAALPPAEANAVLQDNAPRLPEYKMTVAHARALVAETRERGFAARERGVVPGVGSLSVPLPPTPRSPAAALTVAAVAKRITSARIPEVVAVLAETVPKILRSLPG